MSGCWLKTEYWFCSLSRRKLCWSASLLHCLLSFLAGCRRESSASLMVCCWQPVLFSLRVLPAFFSVRVNLFCSFIQIKSPLCTGSYILGLFSAFLSADYWKCRRVSISARSDFCSAGFFCIVVRRNKFKLSLVLYFSCHWAVVQKNRVPSLVVCVPLHD